MAASMKTDADVDAKLAELAEKAKLEADEVFAKGSTALDKLQANDQVIRIRGEAQKLLDDAKAFEGSAEGERLKAEAQKLKSILEVL
jgi:hypothetical protein